MGSVCAFFFAITPSIPPGLMKKSVYFTLHTHLDFRAFRYHNGSVLTKEGSMRTDGLPEASASTWVAVIASVVVAVSAVIYLIADITPMKKLQAANSVQSEPVAQK